MTSKTIRINAEESAILDYALMQEKRELEKALKIYSEADRTLMYDDDLHNMLKCEEFDKQRLEIVKRLLSKI